MTEPADEAERIALLGASDIVMIDNKRRLRLDYAARAEILDAVVGSEPYENTLRQAVAADIKQHKAIGNDPVRLPSAWLRCFLSGEFASLKPLRPCELKAALAARERLRLVGHLNAKVPTLDDLGRRVGLAELLEPLRLLTGEQAVLHAATGSSVGTTRWRSCDELRSRSAVELIVRGATRAKRALTGSESPGLMMVEGRGGGKLRNVIKVRRIIDRRLAKLSEWTATGVFAIGVQVKNASGFWISLELDLAQLPHLPKRFLDR